MNKKIVYSLVGLALIFFIGSLIIFIKSNKEAQQVDNEPAAIEKDVVPEKIKKKEFQQVKVFFLKEETRLMRPLQFKLEVPSIRQDLYRQFVELLLRGSGNEDYIVPVPEGVGLRSLYFVENRSMLVLDFSEQLIHNMSGGTMMELEFIYYIVDNICYNFEEVKMVKFMVAGNVYKVFSGHIDMENAFFPDYRYILDDKED